MPNGLAGDLFKDINRVYFGLQMIIEISKLPSCFMTSDRLEKWYKEIGTIRKEVLEDLRSEIENQYLEENKEHSFYV